ncbi:hypothetical protein [Anabaena sp. UHCC 0253]|uniref:hypothetical protein n=1 Tax=Anabaena sp. UHCC 0253 TaxID=2590019 RepID=UPI001580607D|nr:hypothetical protein [Anabaena sp. UHCC 0253]
MNIKFAISATLLTTTLLLTPINSQETLAQTCASNCGPAPLQFTPGQYIRVQVINRSYGAVRLEQLPVMRKKTLQHGEKFQFDLEGGNLDEFTLMFWDDGGRFVKGVVSKPNFGTLVLEIRPNSRNYPGDRSLYIRNDGRVSIL